MRWKIYIDALLLILKKIFMGKKITPVPLSRVPKLEYPELVLTFVRIVEHYDAAAMHIADSFAQLNVRIPELMKLKLSKGKHPETKEIQTLLLRRKDIVNAMLGQTRKLVKADLSVQKAHIKLLSPFIEKYWAGIQTFNQNTMNARMKLMLADIESNIALHETLTAVGLMSHVDELKAIETNLFQIKESRRISKSEAPKIDTRQIKSFVGEAVTDVVNAIEIARKAHAEVNYLPMITEINDLFRLYHSGIKAHSTRVKNANEIKTEESAA